MNRQGTSSRSREARIQVPNRHRHRSCCCPRQIPLRFAKGQANLVHFPHQECHHGACESRVLFICGERPPAECWIDSQEGAFAFVFKSVHYPDEVVIARRGSPVLIGVKTERKLKVDFVDVEFAGAADEAVADTPTNGAGSGLLGVPSTTAQGKLVRSQSRAFLSDDGMPQPIEFFIASDASAIVEHTKRVLYLEDDDIAHIAEGGKSTASLHRIRSMH